MLITIAFIVGMLTGFLVGFLLKNWLLQKAAEQAEKLKQAVESHLPH